MQAVLSIHDVMPETLALVQQILTRITVPADKTTLLIVPGKPWQEQDLKQLRLWQKMGYPLAGHGWHHQANTPQTWYHVHGK